MLVMRFWAGFAIYWYNYGVCGYPEGDKFNAAQVLHSLTLCKEHTNDALSDKFKLLRLMKIGMAKIKNRFHSDAEPLEVNMEKRDIKRCGHMEHLCRNHEHF